MKKEIYNMKITKVKIAKFRAFKDVEFELGEDITIIAGQNGTQKTTMLGILTQTFAINSNNEMKEEKPLSGGSFKSSFSEKFKLSEKFDKAGEHEWTLDFDDGSKYPIESINRDKNKGTIRFWKKGDKTKGSGYADMPVIFLSLKRLLPLGEDGTIKESNNLTLNEEEKKFYSDWHNKILIFTRDQDKTQEPTFLSSKEKQTLGANTTYYDWKSNSAGQDNIGKILLAVLSFKRLQKKYTNNYQGGILAIDEVDATLYPASQIKLINALRKFASQFNLQIIFTTHSLSIIKETSRIIKEENQQNKMKLLFLKKIDSSIVVNENIGYDFIENELNKTLSGINQSEEKLQVFTEDAECAMFAKSLLGVKRTKHLNFIDIPLGCGNLTELSRKKIPAFSFPNSIIILDGDVRTEKKKMGSIKRCKNIIILPKNVSIERIIANFLDKLNDTDPFWGSINENFNHQYCFQTYTLEEINKDREKAKKWFNSHLEKWGRNAYKVLKVWKQSNSEYASQFCSDFDETLKLINKKKK